MQIIAPLIPSLQEMQKEGEAGRTRVAQYTRILAVPLAMLQGYAQATLLARQGIIQNFGLFDRTTFLPTVSLILSLTAGTMFLVWLGELITEKGIGNGISLIIFAGIIAGLPGFIGRGIFNASGVGGGITGIGILFAIGMIMIGAIVVFNEAQRKIPVQYS